jgi:iron complex transport system ATP-binding protein
MGEADSLRAAGIEVVRGGKKLLDGVSAEIVPGRVTALLGPNGAGKSTLLHVLSGDTVPDAGEVTLDGRGIETFRARDLALRRAVLTQQSLLDFPFTAEQVVLLGRAPHFRGWSETARDIAAARFAMAEVDIAGRAAQLYPTLSGGERQRVHLARALTQLDGARAGGGGRYLLLDEPTSNLDVSHAHVTLDLARARARSGFGVLVVLHDFQLAGFYADEVVVLHGGRVAASGPVQAVLTPGLVEEVFQTPAVRIEMPPAGAIVMAVPGRLR